MEQMEERKMTRRVYVCEIEGGNVRGQPPVKWRDRVQECVREMGEGSLKNFEQARRECPDRKRWKLFCHGHPLVGAPRSRHQKWLIEWLEENIVRIVIQTFIRFKARSFWLRTNLMARAGVKGSSKALYKHCKGCWLFFKANAFGTWWTPLKFEWDQTLLALQIRVSCLPSKIFSLWGSIREWLKMSVCWRLCMLSSWPYHSQVQVGNGLNFYIT